LQTGIRFRDDIWILPVDVQGRYNSAGDRLGPIEHARQTGITIGAADPPSRPFA
jgi:hypothetical protein